MIYTPYSAAKVIRTMRWKLLENAAINIMTR
jgi:hypothetical protein